MFGDLIAWGHGRAGAWAKPSLSQCLLSLPRALSPMPPCSQVPKHRKADLRIGADGRRSTRSYGVSIVVTDRLYDGPEPEDSWEGGVVCWREKRVADVSRETPVARWTGLLPEERKEASCLCLDVRGRENRGVTIVGRFT